MSKHVYSNTTIEFDNVAFDKPNKMFPRETAEKNTENQTRYETQDDIYEKLKNGNCADGVNKNTPTSFQPGGQRTFSWKYLVIAVTVIVMVLQMVLVALQIYIILKPSAVDCGKITTQSNQEGHSHLPFESTIAPVNASSVGNTTNPTDFNQVISNAIHDLKQVLTQNTETFRTLNQSIHEQHAQVYKDLGDKIDTLNQQTEVLQDINKNLEEKIIDSQSDQLSAISTQVSRLGYGRPYPPVQALVFHLQSPSGVYKLTFEEAKALCVAEGATIATLAQLQVALELGMSVCRCGWLSDGSSRFPEYWPTKNCGGVDNTDLPQIFGPCTHSETYDVYCFKD